ncbi:hypothetical protein [Escherichia phage UPWr_E2]
MKMQDLLALPAQALKGNISFWIFNDQDNYKPVIIPYSSYLLHTVSLKVPGSISRG